MVCGETPSRALISSGFKPPKKRSSKKRARRGFDASSRFKQIVDEEERLRVAGIGGGRNGVVERLALAGGAFGSRAGAGIIDQYLAHSAGGHGEEMVAVLNVRLLLVAEEFNPGLVEQRGGRKRMIGSFGAQATFGDAVQMFVDEGR